jgi:deoxyribodipyrimidine photo-lyase
MTIHDERIRRMNDLSAKEGDFVLYWMQQSQRECCNHALEYAIREANRLSLPLIVCFGLTDTYPEANIRHYAFMLEGLAEVEKALKERGIRFVLRKGKPHEIALALGKKAALIVCDMGYMQHQKKWREIVAGNALCQVMQVESDSIVPVETASGKPEYAARTIRPKIWQHLDTFLTGLEKTRLEKPSLGLDIYGEVLENPARLIASLKLDKSIRAVPHFFRGGTSKAKGIFKNFINNSLKNYDKNSNQPQTDDISRMSPYLHFGQISPLYLALEVKSLLKKETEAAEAYLEELIIRRELAINFVYYTPDYDSYSCLPDWAKITLDEHRKDRRDFVYSSEELIKARTHDPYWNAAMREMATTGFMHNYMRMYWGKKILEWTPDPQEAFKTALFINNRYFIDGRDPNSYGGVAWVFGKHDRAWKERPIFGKIRYMAASGLEKKCDISAYVKKVDKMEAFS